ncbi:MAG: (d)CMP kinase [Lachnospiraceae bacterium]
MKYSIAIDGPAGAGKSTIAKQVAKDLGYIYVDTGAMYRAMAYYFISNEIAPGETEKIEESCFEIEIRIQYVDGVQQVVLNGENITDKIRAEEVGNMASQIAVIPCVRMKLVDLQRTLAQKENVIMDGRDIGTYVLPDATCKIYLTASSAERARRRYAELFEKGITCDMDEIEADIIARDERDMNREFAPLRQAEDAVYLDSSDMSIDEVVTAIKNLFDKVMTEQ